MIAVELDITIHVNDQPAICLAVGDILKAEGLCYLGITCIAGVNLADKEIYCTAVRIESVGPKDVWRNFYGKITCD